MITLAEVQAFCTVARAATTPHALMQAVEEITAVMGFRYFALVHHVDLLNPGSTIVRLVSYTNAPMAEGDRYRNPLGFQVENYRADPEVVR